MNFVYLELGTSYATLKLSSFPFLIVSLSFFNFCTRWFHIHFIFIQRMAG